MQEARAHTNLKNNEAAEEHNESTQDKYINYGGGDNYFLFTMQTQSQRPDVDDEDNNTGYMSRQGTAFFISGVYTIMAVTANFSGGLFDVELAKAPKSYSTKFIQDRHNGQLRWVIKQTNIEPRKKSCRKVTSRCPTWIWVSYIGEVIVTPKDESHSGRIPVYIPMLSKDRNDPRGYFNCYWSSHLQAQHQCKSRRQKRKISRHNENIWHVDGTI